MYGKREFIQKLLLTKPKIMEQGPGNQVNSVNLPPTVYTITDTMFRCGVSNTDIFNGETAARRLASDIFSDSYDICMDKTMEEVQNDLKHYSNLTQAQGQIRITPGVIQRIQAFIQWTRDMIHVGLDPSLTEFPVENTALLITHYKTHKAFVEKTKTISEAAKPIKFKEKYEMGGLVSNLHQFPSKHSRKKWSTSKLYLQRI